MGDQKDQANALTVRFPCSIAVLTVQVLLVHLGLHRAPAPDVKTSDQIRAPLH